MKVTRKFTIDNSKKEVKHFGTGMFDLVFLELSTVNLRVTSTKKLQPLPVSFAALSTSVQNVVTTCLRARAMLWRACGHDILNGR